MTLYLWHIRRSSPRSLICHAAGLDAYDPAQPFFWPLLMLRAAVFTVAMSVLFVALTPRRAPRPCRGGTRRSSRWGARSTAMGGHPLVCTAGVSILLMAKQAGDDHGVVGTGRLPRRPGRRPGPVRRQGIVLR